MKCPECNYSGLKDGYGIKKCPECLSTWVVTSSTGTQERPRSRYPMDRTLWANSNKAAINDASIAITDGSFDGVFEIEPKRDPSKTYCSFCGEQTDRINATEGTGKIRMRLILQEVIGPDGKPETIEKMTAEAPKVLACNKCCLHVRNPVIVTTV